MDNPNEQLYRQYALHNRSNKNTRSRKPNTYRAYQNSVGRNSHNDTMNSAMGYQTPSSQPYQMNENMPPMQNTGMPNSNSPMQPFDTNQFSSVTTPVQVNPWSLGSSGSDMTSAIKHRHAPSSTIQQPSDINLIRRVDILTKQNEELRNEISSSKQKIASLEQQLYVFYGKLLQMERSVLQAPPMQQKPNQAADGPPNQPPQNSNQMPDQQTFPPLYAQQQMQHPQPWNAHSQIPQNLMDNRAGGNPNYGFDDQYI